jgi:putative ABC transport system permease protein
MTFFDLFSLILENLGRRKARVALTAIGVVIGTAAVVVLVSLAIGLQQNATQQLYGIGDLTQIMVWPNYGEYSPVEKGGSSQPQQPKLLTDKALQEIAAIPGVAAVVPRDYFYGYGMVYVDRLETWANINGVGTKDLSVLGLEAHSGEITLAKGTMIVGSMVANNFYSTSVRTGQEPPGPPDLLGKRSNWCWSSGTPRETRSKRISRCAWWEFSGRPAATPTIICI